MKQNLIGLFFLSLLISCEEQKPFVWTDDIAQITGKNLAMWIEKSPFNGKWNKLASDEDLIIFDNRKQVFPFMGKFKNDVDDFKNFNHSDGDIHQEEVVLYQDSNFGESFVYSALLYEPQELFLKKFYSETGDMLFSGTNSINERYSASLSETLLFERNETYKAAIYRVNSNYKNYLFGFYQRGKLVVQFGFPCTVEQTQEGIDKIKEINANLDLNITSWSQATVESLVINNNPQGFWKDPYQGLYIGEYMLPELQVKVKNTSYKMSSNAKANAEGVDYMFINDSEGGQYTISFKREITSLNKEKFEDQFNNNSHISVKDYDETKLFITNEKSINGINSMDIETYFIKDSFLKIQIRYPQNDTKAKDQLLDILTSLRIKRF